VEVEEPDPNPTTTDPGTDPEQPGQGNGGILQ